MLRYSLFLSKSSASWGGTSTEDPMSGSTVSSNLAGWAVETMMEGVLGKWSRLTRSAVAVWGQRM